MFEVLWAVYFLSSHSLEIMMYLFHKQEIAGYFSLIGCTFPKKYIKNKIYSDILIHFDIDQFKLSPDQLVRLHFPEWKVFLMTILFYASNLIDISHEHSCII